MDHDEGLLTFVLPIRAISDYNRLISKQARFFSRDDAMGADYAPAHYFVGSSISVIPGSGAGDAASLVVFMDISVLIGGNSSLPPAAAG